MAKRHPVRAGEGVESVAYANGFFWETVWNLGDNAPLRQLREDPNILEEGDIVVVPDRQPKMLPESTDQRHRFRRKGVPSRLRVRLLDQDRPRAGVSYTVIIGRRRISGASDAEGWIRCFLMPDVTKGVLELEDGESYEFEIGTVRPSDMIQGVQSRLRNLGYYNGPIDGVISEDLQGALRLFQLKRRLEVTGEPDDATRQALEDDHGS